MFDHFGWLASHGYNLGFSLPCVGTWPAFEAVKMFDLVNLWVLSSRYTYGWRNYAYEYTMVSRWHRHIKGIQLCICKHVCVHMAPLYRTIYTIRKSFINILISAKEIQTNHIQHSTCRLHDMATISFYTLICCSLVLLLFFLCRSVQTAKVPPLAPMTAWGQLR